MGEKIYDDELNNINPISEEKLIRLELSYTDYGVLLNTLLNEIKKSNIKYSAVYGVPNSGLPIAVHLSKNLKTPLILNIHQYIKNNTNINNIKRLLVVDNIINHNENLLRFCDLIESLNIKYDTAALHYRSEENLIPTYTIKKIEQDKWIVYPWD
jgi:hypoxanthine phosphoribosyltransferase